jgi:hypothetical protein
MQGEKLATRRTLVRLAKTVSSESIAIDYSFAVGIDGKCAATAHSGRLTEFTSVAGFLLWLEPVVRVQTGEQWNQSSWDKAVAEILQSLRNESLVQAYRVGQWDPWLARLISQFSCRTTWEYITQQVKKGEESKLCHALRSCARQ